MLKNLTLFHLFGFYYKITKGYISNMAFCTFSSEQIIKDTTSIENSFFVEFLPIAPDAYVKVYLFGLYNCNNPVSKDNSLQAFSRILNMSEEDIISVFMYWQELGLVQMLNVNPMEIRYLPISSGSARLKKYNKDKYKSFNIQAQEILSGRMITPTEYDEYYYLMESLHLEADALIKIIKYCVDFKQNNDLGYKYIISVAKSWAYQGYTTVEKVEERLMEQQAIGSDISLVLKALGSKKSASIEEYQLFLNWTDTLGFSSDVIVQLAKKVKKAKGGINKLDYLLNKFYEMRITSIKEIDAYLEKEQELFEIAKEVCKNIGVRYDNLQIVVDTYVNNWLNLGYDSETLSFITVNSFKNSIRTLEGVNNVINQFYKLGLITKESIENHLDNLRQKDSAIANILEKLGIIRNVNKFDREYYNTWLFNWQINEEVLEYAISLSKDKVSPMQFLNKILSVYHNKNITTLEQAKEEKIEAFGGYGNSSVKSTQLKRAKKHEYTKAEFDAMFTSIDEVEI